MQKKAWMEDEEGCDDEALQHPHHQVTRPTHLPTSVYPPLSSKVKNNESQYSIEAVALSSNI